jgi:DNA-binding transcriptional LysR family regulator
MELRHLRYFVAVADAEHMTRAAAQLGIHQPPLSMQIRALEQELGLPLLHRHPKGVRLSEAGRTLLPEARRILQDVAELKRRFAGMSQGTRGVLAVGFTSSAAAHAFTPAALRACRTRYPDIELVISEANAAEVIEGVASHRLHCGIVRVPVARPAGVVFEAVLSEPALLAIPSDHPLASSTQREDAVPLESLHGQPLILVRRSGAPGLYANLLASCAKRAVEPRVVAEVDRMMTNLNLVAAGVGLSVVPASMRGAHPTAVVYRHLAGDAGLEAPMTLAWREEDALGPTATLLNLMRETARNWPSQVGTSDSSASTRRARPRPSDATVAPQQAASWASS